MRPLLLACCAATLAAATVDNSWVGYGGPGGSHIYPGTYPTEFDHTAGKGVLWETPLPTWGHGSPIAIGNRVFVACEPGPENLFPLLVCLDGPTGKILWKQEIKTPEQERQRAVLAEWSQAHYAAIRANTGQAKRQSDKTVGTLTGKARDLMGLQVDMFRNHASQYAAAYACFGEAYATPVSDGAHVWACNTWGSYVCFDMDGKVVWATYDPLGRAAPSGGGGCNSFGRSPILAGNLLISDLHYRVRAFDRATGRLCWVQDYKQLTDSISPPAVITVGTRQVLLVAGMKAISLPDGKELAIQGWKDPGNQMLVKPDEPDVVFFCGSGEHCAWTNKGDADPAPPAAVRFSLTGDALTGTVLWQGAQLDKGLKGGGNEPWMCSHAGRFYHRAGVILDALTGTPIESLARREKYSPKGVPQTHHLTVVAGQHVYGLRPGIGLPASQHDEAIKGRPTAEMQVMTLDGRLVAQNPLMRTGPTPAQRAMHAYCTGQERPWMEGREARFAYGYTFTFGDGRIYIRSLENLICIGR
jgi:outer membrane protein assembly factor BamB